MMNEEALPRSKSGERSARVGAALARYAAAAIVVALAGVARLSLDSFLGQEVVPFSFFYLAVAVTGWWLGFWPTIFASLLGLIGGMWLIIPPRHSLMIHSLRSNMEVLVYLFVAGIITFLMNSLRKARTQALERQRELELEIERRRQTEAALRRSEALLEGRVKERTTELEATVDELKRFSYAIIHDMRAPLRSMRGFAEIIEEESEATLTSTSQEYLRRIEVACNRMDRLIRDSLSYNRALLTKLPLQPVDLSKLLRELCITYSNLQPHQAGIHVQEALPSVLGNEPALTQCFSILLGNAVKFVGPNVAPQVWVWADRNDLRAIISVRDNGIGIPASTQRHLFGIFQRHDRKHEGTGIGLAIVRKLVERMGGSVGVESEEGKGSRFWLELNVATAATPVKQVEVAAVEEASVF